jgi:hypothetical protein
MKIGSQYMYTTGEYPQQEAHGLANAPVGSLERGRGEGVRHGWPEVDAASGVS